jgi:hypothetical protein
MQNSPSMISQWGISFWKRGSIIKVRGFAGRIYRRRIVNFNNKTVYVCTNEEFITSQQQDRKPVCVGFPLDTTVSTEPDEGSAD